MLIELRLISKLVVSILYFSNVHQCSMQLPTSRIETGVDIQIAAMVQMVQSSKHQLTRCEQRLRTYQRDAVVVTESSGVKQIKWECDTDSDWIAYSPKITATLEMGFTVSVACLSCARACWHATNTATNTQLQAVVGSAKCTSLYTLLHCAV
jgi:hypothetical protein